MEPHPQVPSIAVAEGELHQSNLSSENATDDERHDSTTANSSIPSSWLRYDYTRRGPQNLAYNGSERPHAEALDSYASGGRGGAVAAADERDTMRRMSREALYSQRHYGSEPTSTATPVSGSAPRSGRNGKSSETGFGSVPPSLASSVSSPPSPPPSPATPQPAATGNFTRYYEHPTEQPAAPTLPFPSRNGGSLSLSELVYVLSSTVRDML